MSGERIPPSAYNRQDGAAFVTEDQIAQYHDSDGLERFKRWSMTNTQLLVGGRSGFFVSDYENWLDQGMPDAPWEPVD